MEQDVVEQRPRDVTSRFELAASRMADAWLEAGRMEVSAADLRIAREFLEQAGWKVEERTGGTVRLSQQGRTQDLSREEAVMLALRRLAGRTTNV